MPLYEYRCAACREVFERLVAMSDPSPPCPSCGSSEVAKLMSAFGGASAPTPAASFG